jgi:hypothetical protein
MTGAHHSNIRARQGGFPVSRAKALSYKARTAIPPRIASGVTTLHVSSGALWKVTKKAVLRYWCSWRPALRRAAALRATSCFRLSETASALRGARSPTVQSASPEAPVARGRPARSAKTRCPGPGGRAVARPEPPRGPAATAQRVRAAARAGLAAAAWQERAAARAGLAAAARQERAAARAGLVVAARQERAAAPAGPAAAAWQERAARAGLAAR